MNPPPPNTNDAARWHPAAAVAGWLLPGMGHAMVGQRKRGIIIGVTIGALWLAGLLIGGLGVIDRAENGAWFVGQVLAGPAIIVDYVVQVHLKPRSADSNPEPLLEPSFGHVREQGILYTALAGLLNLLAVLDVVYRDPNDHLAAQGAEP